MTAGAVVATAAAAWVLVSVPAAILAARWIARRCPCENTGNLLADLPVDCLGQPEIDFEFFALTDPIEAEIDRRLS